MPKSERTESIMVMRLLLMYLLRRTYKFAVTRSEKAVYSPEDTQPRYCSFFEVVSTYEQNSCNLPHLH